MASRYWVGGTATWDATAGTKWAATSGGAGGQTVPGAADIVFFDANSGANTVTLGASTTISRLIMLAFPGTLAFGTNTISLNSNSTTVFFGDTTYSVTGTPVINLIYSGSAGTRFVNTTAVTEANSISFNVTAGTDTVHFFSAANAVRDLDFTGFSGTLALLLGAIYGNLKLASGVTWTNSAVSLSFAKASGTQTITSNGVTAGAIFTVNSAGTTVTLADNLTSANSIALTAGTFDLAGKTLSATAFSSAGSSTRVLAFGVNGAATFTSSGASAFLASGSNLTTTGTGAVNMTSASAKTFAGGGFSYSAKLNQGGAGALTISGSNTFPDITSTYNSTGACTITFTAGTTQTVTQFTASGTAGKLLTLNSSSAGNQFTLSDASGYNTVSYCDIKDSSATGGAVWQAFTANGNVNSGNNIGWDFTAPDVVSYTLPINLRSFTERRGFN